MKYASLVIDNRSDNTDRLYTYGCDRVEVSPGDKVYVPFSRSNSLREAYVISVDDDAPEDVKKKLRYIEKVDEDVSLSSEMLRTALWMKRRYICRYIDAINCFTPAGEKAKSRAVKNPLENVEEETERAEKLTEQQEEALRQINSAVRKGKHDRFLIHGVTGSGKTEIYMRAAEEVLKRGQSVIVLVPEISLTGQITERFTGRFGSEDVAVLHSRLSAGERYDQWKKTKDSRAKIVIGARSAVFAPLENIGLIVIDEEHETTYKSDYTPKYDTAEVALKRMQDRDNHGLLILGSATPSVVTYSRSEEGIYRLIKLTERYNKMKLPHIDVVDMRRELKNGNRSIISMKLRGEMKRQLEDGRQVILFLNRRGYSAFISCRTCGYVAKCPHCGLSLTYHKSEDKMICHYCGYTERIPRRCPECGSEYIKYFGSGTEKLEEAVREIFGEYETARVDLDTVRRKGELSGKLKAFREGKTDILIGTQLIAKGLDFRNVGLSGIVSADVSLNIPDFRSAERTFQLITQAAGRAGRGDEAGSVVVQTYSPDNYAVKFAALQDYEGFYKTEMQLRKFLVYPPYSDLFQIVFTSKSKENARRGAEIWYEKIRERLKNERGNVYRPQEAYMGKIKDIYRYSLLIKCPRGKRNEYANVVSDVRDEENRRKKKEYKAVADINPYSFI